MAETDNRTGANAEENEEQKRMELNRLRAREIRKRKKKMEEEMRQKIIQLTLENNRLSIQKKMQQDEIDRLKQVQNSSLTNMIVALNQQQQQQSLLSGTAPMRQNILSMNPTDELLLLQQRQHQQMLQQQNGLQSSSLSQENSSLLPGEALLSTSAPGLMGNQPTMTSKLHPLIMQNLSNPGLLGTMGYANQLGFLNQEQGLQGGGNNSVENITTTQHHEALTPAMISSQISSFQLPTTGQDNARETVVSNEEVEAKTQESLKDLM